MRGVSGARLMKADDGYHYVVKSVKNPERRRILINEYVSHVLMAAMGIDTPPVAFLTTLESINDGVNDPCFASRYPFHPDQFAIYDFLPDSLLATIANRDAFFGALVFDKWTSNADARQAIFYRARVQSPAPVQPAKTALVAQMIDNGQAFQGLDWTFRDSPVQGVYGRPCVYGENLNWRDFDPWIEKMRAISLSFLMDAVLATPPSWCQGEEEQLAALMSRLWSRRERVPELVADSVLWILERQRLTSSFVQKSPRPFTLGDSCKSRLRMKSSPFDIGANPVIA